mmetsp:Transcript_23696/g.34795  ORF Transcript_23696/g.34795 Transcript_23696/m.34795 type:complete len:131 (+) Transcript_23696:80-472(+)
MQTRRALGLMDRKADVAAIRQAFMKKAKVCHPDVNASPEAAEDFRKVSEAYERLSDAQLRLAYDSAWMQMRAGVRDAEIIKPPTPAQAAIIALAGAVSAAPVVIPITLAHFCVEPFASVIKSMSTSCPNL